MKGRTATGIGSRISWHALGGTRWQDLKALSRHAHLDVTRSWRGAVSDQMFPTRRTADEATSPAHHSSGTGTAGKTVPNAVDSRLTTTFVAAPRQLRRVSGYLGHMNYWGRSAREVTPFHRTPQLFSTRSHDGHRASGRTISVGYKQIAALTNTPSPCVPRPRIIP